MNWQIKMVKYWSEFMSFQRTLKAWESERIKAVCVVLSGNETELQLGPTVSRRVVRLPSPRRARARRLMCVVCVTWWGRAPVNEQHLPSLSPSLAGTVIGVVIYTGKETRSVLNTSYAKNKVNTWCFCRKPGSALIEIDFFFFNESINLWNNYTSNPQMPRPFFTYLDLLLISVSCLLIH